MKYVIAGGDGFVGRHLVESLLQLKAKVAVVDIKKSDLKIYDLCEHYCVDVRDQKMLLQIPLDYDDIVINLAATQYHERVPRANRKEYFFDTNFDGTVNLLQTMKQRGCHKFVFYSTDMTYGKPQYLPVDVKHPQNPFGPYGASKKAAENVCREFRANGFNISIFRPRMILGPGRLGVLTKLFRLMDYNLPVPLIGDGSNCYQMVSVYDCVDATIKALNHGIPNGEYNLGSVNPPTVSSLLQDVIVKAGSKSKLLKTNGSLVKGTLALLGKLGAEILYKEQYEIADENYIVDISNAESELGWMPRYTDKDMLFSAYEYYEQMKK